MVDDTGKTDNRDRSNVSAGQDFEVEYFAGQAGITLAQARQLLQRHGDNRAKLMEEARLINGHLRL